MADINLDGTEIQIIKCIGIGSGEISGEALAQRAAGLMLAELIDALKGLIAMGYVVADKGSFQSSEEFNKTHFHVNSGYSREIKESLNPTPDRGKSKRVRRE